MTETTTVALMREPKQRRSKESIEKICAATLLMAQESGLAALNTNAIAARAGVDTSSLYRFFPNKAAILQFIVSRWMGEVRLVWNKYETDVELLKLGWEDYFRQISIDWQNRDTQDNYSALHDAWTLYPELEEMDRQHREYYTNFFIRQMQRFRATGTRKNWKDLAVYLYVMEDEVHSIATKNAFSSVDAGRDLFLKTMLFHLGQIMP